MRSTKFDAFLTLSLFAGAQQARPAEPQPQAPATSQPDGDIEVRGKWRAEPQWPHPGPMPRHYIVELWGVPAPYQGMTNPPPAQGNLRSR